MQEKYRHEFKHEITYADYEILKRRLKLIANKDKHTNDDGTYVITSLYFDNFRDKALREKIDGVDNREKFRIRYYNDDLSFISLEKKTKLRGLCRKESCNITKEECEKLLYGDFSWLDDKENDTALEFYTKIKNELLRPKTIVRYLREPFVYKAGNVRITFDGNIRTGLYNTDFLKNNFPMIPAGDKNAIILEVKYDEFLPDIIKLALSATERQNGAFSKYAACRIYG